MVALPTLEDQMCEESARLALAPACGGTRRALAIMPCTMPVNDVWTPPVPGAGMGYSSSGFHSGCSAWYSNEPGAGSALGRPASAAASRALITASALRRDLGIRVGPCVFRIRDQP